MSATLTRRVLPQDAKSVREQLAAMAAAVRNGPVLPGAQGEAVKALQAHLAAAGLYGGPVNGSFDAATEAALKAFQQAKRLPATGRLDAGSFRQLKSVDVFVKDGFADSVARQGQRGKDILKVEKQLATLGFLARSEADGVYDGDTGKAVAAYRRADAQVGDKGNFITATFGKEVGKAAKGYAHAPWRHRTLGNVQPHRRLDEYTEQRASDRDGIHEGNWGRAVVNIQRHLEAAGYELGKTSGTYNARTAAAVRAFQKQSKLPETGVVDSKTWRTLRGCLFAAKDAASPAQKLGEHSAQVKKTKKMLTTLGVQGLGGNSAFGTRLEDAVERYQKSHHLKATGEVDARTLKSITGSYQKKVAPQRPSVKGYKPLPQVSWRAGLDRYSQEMYGRLLAQLKKMGVSTSGVRVAQGNYSTGVGASGGTHNRGGAIDLYAPLSKYKAILKAAAKVGWAPFDRRTMDPPHLHMVALGHPDVAWDANDQIRDFFLGRNGLVTHAASRDSAALRHLLPAWAKKMRDRYVSRRFP